MNQKYHLIKFDLSKITVYQIFGFSLSARLKEFYLVWSSPVMTGFTLDFYVTTSDINPDRSPDYCLQRRENLSSLTQTARLSVRRNRRISTFEVTLP